MNLISILSNMVFVCCLFLGIYVLIQDHKRGLNRLFFLLCLFLAFWDISFFFATTYGNSENFEAWIRTVSSFAIPSMAIGYHIIINITQKRKIRKIEASLIYLPAIFILAVIFIRHSLLFDYIPVDGRWKMKPAYNCVLFYIFALYSVGFAIISFILIFLYGRKTVLKKEKKQAFWLTVTMIAGTSIVAVKRFLLPFFHIYRFPDVGIDFIAIYIIGLYFSVFRYKFMTAKPFIIADEIISNIGGIVALLDGNLRILSVNRRMAELLTVDENDLKNKPLAEIAVVDERFEANMENLRSGKNGYFPLKMSYKKPGETIATNSRISAVKDRFSDLIGFLVISKELKGKKQLQDAFHISDREFEIIELTIAGHTNKEIGAILKITERTVESHYLHIYKKIGIYNKIELMNIAHDFNLFPAKN